jgi:hypothetical protein
LLYREVVCVEVLAGNSGTRAAVAKVTSMAGQAIEAQTGQSHPSLFKTRQLVNVEALNKSNNMVTPYIENIDPHLT